MTRFKCSQCGQEHEGFPALAYDKPVDFYRVPEGERPRRVKWTPDLCVIDKKQFIIRAVLQLPILDYDGTLDFGIWVEVAQKDFERYLKIWKDLDVSHEPPVAGTLSGGIKMYPESHHLAVFARHVARKRPLITVISEQHPLGYDQRHGITLDRATEIVHILLPNGVSP
jgi:hypothetical protein